MTEHLEVLIIGAGISGVSAAWHLQDRCPTKTYAILERRENMGGTWDLFKYPGIRSDSDMFTLGFRFKPWESATAIADGPSILQYIKDAAAENGIDKHIRFNHQVVAADWSDADNRWTLTVDRAGEQGELTCSFLFVCSGYYNYDEGYSPTFAGSKDFEGTIVHPQHWPEDLDYQGKKIVVIGSGATAVTLIPALIDNGAGHVTMLQRSPTYIGSLPVVDPFATQFNKYLPTKAAHFANRWKAIIFATAQYQLARRFPAMFKKLLREMAERRLPEGFDYDTHFSPRYKPWDQRVCVAPNGDLFKKIRQGTADVVTDTIETFTKTGIKLDSGAELEADIIITATGLNMQLLGGIDLEVDGEPVRAADHFIYKGMMLSGVPNLFTAFGYTNASWTLRSDLTARAVCRLLKAMDAKGREVCVARPPAGLERRPVMELNSGYVRRAASTLPHQADRQPWRVPQHYLKDAVDMTLRPIDEGLELA